MSDLSPHSTTAVRTATPCDIPALAELNAGLFAEDAGIRDTFVNVEWPARFDYFADLVADGKSNVAFVAELDGSPVGYLVGRLQDANDFRPVTTAALESMYVRSNRRSEGVGSALVHTFLAWGQDARAGRVAVNAYCTNVRAIRFYERFGLRPKALTLDMPL